MITKEQAMTVNNFVHVEAKNADGTLLRARRSGKTQTWKTRPDEFKVPVKHGLRDSFYITQNEASRWTPA